MLELIIENAQRVAEMDNDPRNRMKAINYYKSRIKCEIFDKLCDFSSFNYGAINSFSDSEHSGKHKTLFIPSNEPICPYFMMLIRLDEDEKIYVPVSTIAPQDPKRYFEGQEVIIPTQMLITDEERLFKISATASEKIKLLTLYKSIINKYQIPNNINIYGDYESMLNDMEREVKKYHK